jgi:magnesium-transporting ATPase (P-type)
MSPKAPIPDTAGIEQAHAMSREAVLIALESRPEGLSDAQARERLAQFGPNRLPAPPKDSLLRRFFKHFHDLLIYVLIVSAGVTALLGHWIDTAVILAVVLVNAIIGFVQEGKAEQALDGIRKMLSAHAHVRRDGDWVEIPAEDLVPGDIVRLRSGDRVPADLRLLETVNLRIEESALTGESVPTDKDTAAVAPDAGIGDRHGMAYSGTLVAAGRGLGAVAATGPATELGRINRMIAEVQTLETPLTRQMVRFNQVLSVVIVGLALLMVAVGLTLHDYTANEVFLAAIGFAVAAIPEGLPAILTITLALGVQRMAARNAITRRLNAVETLGSVTVICSDKTGTLTRNEMTARHVVTRAGSYEASGTGYAPEGEIRRDGAPTSLAQDPVLRALIEVAAIANDARVVHEGGQWKVTGEPTEGALRTLADKAGFDASGFQRLAVVPFESDTKLMATLDATPDGARHILFARTSPEHKLRLVRRCRPGARWSP